MRRALCIVVAAAAVFSAARAGEAPEDEAARPVWFACTIYYAPKPEGKPAEVLKRLCGEHLKEAALVTDLKADLEADVKPPFVLVKELSGKDVKVPSKDLLEVFGRGLSGEQIEGVQKSEACCLVAFVYARENSLHVLRRACQVVGSAAKETSGLVWDDETRELYSVDKWMATRVEAWKGEFPHAPDQITIHAYRDDQLCRAITLGMAKFGLPDVAVNQFPAGWSAQVGDLISLTCQTMLEGGRPDGSGTVSLDLETLRDTQMVTQIKEALLKEPKSKVELKLAKAERQKGDPDNLILEVIFPGDRQASLQERQAAFLDDFFGSVDAVVGAKHDEELLAASKRAKAKLPELAAAFRKGPGAQVKVRQDEVFDFIRYLPDGSQVGNETGRIIERQDQARKRNQK